MALEDFIRKEFAEKELSKNGIEGTFRNKECFLIGYDLANKGGLSIEDMRPDLICFKNDSILIKETEEGVEITVRDSLVTIDIVKRNTFLIKKL